MNSPKNYFIYQTNAEDEDYNLKINIFCLSENSESIAMISVTDYKLYAYLEIEYDFNSNSMSTNSIAYEIKRRYRLISVEPVLKKKMYFAYTKNTETVMFKCYFNGLSGRGYFAKMVRSNGVTISDGVIVRAHVHELSVSPILQLFTSLGIKSADWISIVAKPVLKEDKITNCKYEYRLSYDMFKAALRPHPGLNPPNPRLLSFDIETSQDPGGNPGKVFMVSMNYTCGKEDKKFLITLGKGPNGKSIDTLYQDSPDEKQPEILPGKKHAAKVQNNVEIVLLKTEADLLIEFSKKIQELNPNVISGYNIFMYDIPYMFDRAKKARVLHAFDQLSVIDGHHAPLTEISWSSSAYGQQKYNYMNAPGRLFVDMYPIIMRDYTHMNDYKLKTVSSTILGDTTKDPVSYQDIFDAYNSFDKKSLSTVARYCMQDSILVDKLFTKIQAWVGLIEMAKVCHVDIFTLYTQGQQIKMFSQVYVEAFKRDLVVDAESSELFSDCLKDDEKYTGAFVLEPNPGVYEMVTSFDFSSLYPSIMIAFNIDYTTFVQDNRRGKDIHTESWTEESNGAKREFSFLQTQPGILPTILKNLLESRAKTRKEQKAMKVNSQVDVTESLEYVVLEKRQLAYKISSNSIYGSLGTKKGYLPFLPGAMTTTAIGRASIQKAMKWLAETHQAKIIYSDTDSAYISFIDPCTGNSIYDRTTVDLFDNVCRTIEKDLVSANIFREPMKLTYEEKIYWRYMIMSKKRYMAIAVDLKGNLDKKLSTKGVLLSRRDYSGVTRDLYSVIVYLVMGRPEDSSSEILSKEEITSITKRNKNPKDNIVDIITTGLRKIRMFDSPEKNKLFILTKKISPIERYTIKLLPVEDAKLKKRFEELNLGYEWSELDLSELRKAVVNLKAGKPDMDLYGEIARQYALKICPAHVQLAEKIRDRGIRVDQGERIHYVITSGPVLGVIANSKKTLATIANDTMSFTPRIAEKIDSYEYYVSNKEYIPIDRQEYISQLIKPVDEILNWYTKKGDVDIMKKIEKYHSTFKKVMAEIEGLITPFIKIN
jgi:DNA polymerase elongation subunit (family B)